MKKKDAGTGDNTTPTPPAPVAEAPAPQAAPALKVLVRVLKNSTPICGGTAAAGKELRISHVKAKFHEERGEVEILGT